MSAADSCGNCRYALRVGDTKLLNAPLQCRRYPPSPLVVPAPTPQGFALQPAFPLMEQTAFCGEHKPVLAS